MLSKHKKKGFTLVEVLLAVGILAFCLSSILLSYSSMFVLSDLSRDITIATSGVQDKLEEVKNTAFDNLALLNGVIFDVSGFPAGNSKGRVEVTDVGYSDLKKVRIVACFKSRNRVIGEDADLNGTLIPSEDINHNSRMDSPVEVVTLISK